MWGSRNNINANLRKLSDERVKLESQPIAEDAQEKKPTMCKASYILWVANENPFMLTPFYKQLAKHHALFPPKSVTETVTKTCNEEVLQDLFKQLNPFGS